VSNRNLLCLQKKLEGIPDLTPTEEKILGEIATAPNEYCGVEGQYHSA